MFSMKPPEKPHTLDQKSPRISQKRQIHILLIALLILLLPLETFSDYEYDDVGQDTILEHLDQIHFESVIYTPFESTAKYSEEIELNWYDLGIAFNITQYLFDTLMYRDPPIPPGYIAVRDEDTLFLGAKVQTNDWFNLIDHYWFLILWVSLLLVMIAIVPLVGVCYCCFCGCRRCQPGCPPCESARDFRICICFGFILLLLIALMILGFVVALMSHKLLERGLKDAAKEMRRGSEDTCTYLKDVKEHINHLFIYNYDEMSTHVAEELTKSHTHKFFDLGDTAESNALEELERILDNMPEALKVMIELKSHHDELKFLSDTIRDLYRGIKREIFYYSSKFRTEEYARTLMKEFDVGLLDTSRCLHIDQMPDTTVYTAALRNIVKKHAGDIPRKGILRYQAIDKVITKYVKLIMPPILSSMITGGHTLTQHANRIQNIIDGLMGAVQLNTLRTAQSFEDFYDNYGLHRRTVNIVALTLIAIIISCLILALIFGCCISRPGGAMLFLTSMILIFSFLSLIILLALFYFIIGLITYHGGCSAWNSKDGRELVQQLGGLFDLNRYISRDEESGIPLERISNSIKTCKGNQSIFKLLRDNHLYNINELTRLALMPDDNTTVFLEENLSTMFILTDEEKKILEDIATGNLASFRKEYFLDNFCIETTTLNLADLINKLKAVPKDNNRFYAGFHANGLYLTSLSKMFDDAHRKQAKNIKSKVEKINELILHNNYQFDSTLKLLINTINRAEDLLATRGNELIAAILTNLTIYVEDEFGKYIDMVIKEGNKNVGSCRPLAYIYHRAVDVVCNRLVDPINGFWLGLLCCALLMIPVLFLCHRLMCLLKKYAHTRKNVVVEAPPPCPLCAERSRLYRKSFSPYRTSGGNIRNNVFSLNELPNSESSVETDEQKRKRD